MPARAAETAQSQAELDRLRARIAELDAALNRDRQEESGLAGEMAGAEKALEQAARARRLAERALAEQDRRTQDAQRAQQQAVQALQGGRENLGRALRAAYMAGSPGPVQLLFRAEDAASLARTAVDSGALAQALSRRVEQVRAQIEHLARAEQALAQARADIEKQQASARAAQAELAQAQARRRAHLAELRERKADRTGALRQAQAEAQRMQKLIENLRRSLREVPDAKFERGKPLAALRGRLPWPLRGELLARWGQPKAGGALSWTGWWIEGPEGAPVRAVADGRVIYVGWVQRFGLMVIVDHPGEYLSLYGHLRDSSVEVGETVQAGSAIAAAGNSGGHDRSGVYFEIRKGTEPVDPAGWLAR